MVGFHGSIPSAQMMEPERADGELPVSPVDRRKLEDWLARCRWLATTRLDDHTRARLDRLIRDLERDLEEDEPRSQP
jgi:O-methyltransferase involved in polyketide biosynthesis